MVLLYSEASYMSREGFRVFFISDLTRRMVLVYFSALCNCISLFIPLEHPRCMGQDASTYIKTEERENVILK